jgi:hypothetical protein
LEKVDVLARKEPNIDIHYVNYSDAVSETEKEVSGIIDFLGENLDKEKMKTEVRKELYRTRLV